MKRMTMILVPAVMLIGCSRPAEPIKAEKVQISAVKLDQMFNERLPEYKGKIVVMDIWGISCGPCKREFPKLVQLQEKYSTKGVQCISLCIPQDGSDAEEKKDSLAFLEKHKAVFPNYWLMDGWEPIQKKLNFEGIPVVVVFGKDGKIAKIFKIQGDSQFTYEDVEKFVAGLLG